MATSPLPSKSATEGTLLLDDTDDELVLRSDYGDVEHGSCMDRSDIPIHKSIVRKLLIAFNMTSRRRIGGDGHSPAPAMKWADEGMLKRGGRSQEIRGRRPRSISGFVKRALFATPFLVLMLFGLLHVMHALLGRAQLFWDVNISDTYLPNWGKQGHIGDGLAHYPTDATRDVLPIPCHSHNDYWRRIPLFDALHWGCTGVEADVWLFDEDLYVGHNLAALTRNRTFESLYVNPLVELLDKMNPDTEFVNASGHGVFDVDPHQTLVLLVDIKTNGDEAFSVISQQLEPLREKGYLSFWDGEKVNSRAITVVGTGNTPFEAVIDGTEYRDIFYDAPLDKLWDAQRSTIQRDDPASDADDQLDESDDFTLPEGNGTSPNQGSDLVLAADAYNATNSYYASVSFTRTIGFVWRGHLSPRQMEIIRGQIRGAKRRGLKARYWDTPQWPIQLRNHVWHVLMKEGADILNVDDLRAAAVDQWQARVHEWW